jgi:RimJ/RimL family protein N-acetyltransferase
MHPKRRRAKIARPVQIVVHYTLKPPFPKRAQLEYTLGQEHTMHILLQTERLILRRFVASDVDALYDLDNDPEVMRYINGGTPTPRDVVQDDILPVFLHYDERLPGFGFWAVTDRETGDFLGWFSFRPSKDTPGEVILGYRLCKAAWGQGYAAEGACALIHKGFSEWGVQRVVATTYEHNLASRRVMEKLGMALVRRFRVTAEDILQADTYHAASVEVWEGDDVEYAMERADWEGQQRAGAR